MLTHVGRPAAVSTARRLIHGLTVRGIQSLLPAGDLAAMAEVLTGQLVGELIDGIGAGSDASCELMVVLGGDGTILRAAEWVVATQIPLLGVNLGHVGFLAEAESTEINEIVEHIDRRSYTVEERNTIVVDVHAPAGPGELGPITWSSFAVNEVSIEKAARERMLELMVEVDGRPLSRWGCDGVLVATPTGSTAYAFSAGGPVIWPGVDATLLVPLSAHALFARPLVLGPRSTVRIELLATYEAADGVVWCDGRRSVGVSTGSRIMTRRGDHRLLLARLSEAPFTDRLVRKFGLRVEGWRGTPAYAEAQFDERPWHAAVGTAAESAEP